MRDQYIYLFKTIRNVFEISKTSVSLLLLSISKPFKTNKAFDFMKKIASNRIDLHRWNSLYYISFEPNTIKNKLNRNWTSEFALNSTGQHICFHIFNIQMQLQYIYIVKWSPPRKRKHYQPTKTCTYLLLFQEQFQYAYCICAIQNKWWGHAFEHMFGRLNTLNRPQFPLDYRKLPNFIKQNPKSWAFHRVGSFRNSLFRDSLSS